MQPVVSAASIPPANAAPRGRRPDAEGAGTRGAETEGALPGARSGARSGPWPGPRPASLPAPQGVPGLRRAQLFIDARHGLGNRLRAVASAAAIAAHTGRELVIIWEPDAHCAARFTDLFRYDGPVIETPFPRLFALAGGRLWNYMEIEPGAEKDAPVLADEAPAGSLAQTAAGTGARASGPAASAAFDRAAAGRGDVYVRSAYPLVSPHAAWPAQRAFLQGLRPVPEVAEMLASVAAPSRVSAHVRMASGPGYEHLPWESPAGWTPAGHAKLIAWRAKSHARHFMARLDALVAEGAADTIFLAADLPETYDAFRDRYGARLRCLPRAVHDRSVEQLRHALADMLLLGRAERFLGSTWSSFSDMACRLAPAPLRVEMSGRDF